MFGRIMRTWPRVVAGMGLLTLFLGLSWVTGIAEQPILSEDLASPRGVIIFAVALLIVVFGCVALPTWVFAALAPGMLGLVDLALMTFLLGIPATLALAVAGAPGWVYCAALAAIYLVAHQIFYGRWLSGFAARNTSGRNTGQGQVADKLNTTGAYSLTRNPLYLGNALMWAAVAMLTGSGE